MSQSESGTVYFLDHVPATSMGGIETVNDLISQQLIREGKHVVWYGPASPPNSAPPPAGIEVRTLPQIEHRFPHPSGIRQFLSDAKEERPEIVWTSYSSELVMYTAAAYLACARDPNLLFVFHIDQLARYPSLTNSPRNRLRQAIKPAYKKLNAQITKAVLHNPHTQTIAVSNAMADLAVSQRFVSKRPEVCNPPTPHNNPDCHPQVRAFTNHWEIKQVCRIAQQKALDEYFIPLAKRAKEVGLPADFSIVGPPGTPEYQRFIEDQSAGVVTLKGPKRGEALCHEYRTADVFSLMSKDEGLPLVIQEALRHACPVLATDIPPIREMLGKTDNPVHNSVVGHLIDTDENGVEQGLDFLRNLITCPDLLPQLSAAALALSTNYDPAILTRRFIDVALRR